MGNIQQLRFSDGVCAGPSGLLIFQSIMGQQAEVLKFKTRVQWT